MNRNCLINQESYTSSAAKDCVNQPLQGGHGWGVSPADTCVLGQASGSQPMQGQAHVLQQRPSFQTPQQSWQSAFGGPQYQQSRATSVPEQKRFHIITRQNQNEIHARYGPGPTDQYNNLMWAPNYANVPQRLPMTSYQMQGSIPMQRFDVPHDKVGQIGGPDPASTRERQALEGPLPSTFHHQKDPVPRDPKSHHLAAVEASASTGRPYVESQSTIEAAEQELGAVRSTHPDKENIVQHLESNRASNREPVEARMACQSVGLEDEQPKIKRPVQPFLEHPPPAEESSAPLQQDPHQLTQGTKSNYANELMAHTQQLSEKFECAVPYNEVYVWGSNKHGQLGVGTTQREDDSEPVTDGIDEALLPKICCFNTVVVKVSCGSNHTLMLSQTGHVYSMGSNQFGQLGVNEPFYERGEDGQKHVVSRVLPCLIEALQDYVICDIAAGNDHSLALAEYGDKVFSWGLGKFGALGNSQSQSLKAPTEIELPNDVMVQTIAAGSRHSAFITKDSQQLYMFGLAQHGQLGLGEECADKVFKPQLVRVPNDLGVEAVALGDTHSVILTSDKKLMCTGSNDKYQLGIDHEQRSLKLFNFQRIESFKKYEADEEIRFKSISCWNLNAAIDEKNQVYFWGLLYDKEVKRSLCIKVPEAINDFKVKQVAIGATMALLIEDTTQKSFVIGVNANGELGLGDKQQRKTLAILNEIRDKKLCQAAVGRTGFVLALSSTVIEPHLASSMENTQERMTSSQMEKSNFEKSDASNQFQKKQVICTKADTLARLQERISELEGEVSLKDSALTEKGVINDMLVERIQQLENKLDDIDRERVQEEIDKLQELMQLNEQRRLNDVSARTRTALPAEHPLRPGQTAAVDQSSGEAQFLAQSRQPEDPRSNSSAHDPQQEGSGHLEGTELGIQTVEHVARRKKKATRDSVESDGYEEGVQQEANANQQKDQEFVRGRSNHQGEEPGQRTSPPSVAAEGRRERPANDSSTHDDGKSVSFHDVNVQCNGSISSLLHKSSIEGPSSTAEAAAAPSSKEAGAPDLFDGVEKEGQQDVELHGNRSPSAQVTKRGSEASAQLNKSEQSIEKYDKAMLIYQHEDVGGHDTFGNVPTDRQSDAGSLRNQNAQIMISDQNAEGLDEVIETEQHEVRKSTAADRETLTIADMQMVQSSKAVAASDNEVIHNLQLQVKARESDQMHLEQEVQSLQKKLDSLVKFLEDERAQRKKTEAEVQQRDDIIQDLRCQIQQYEGQFKLLNQEIDHVRQQKQRQYEENHELKVKIFEMERRARVAQAAQNQDKLFLNYNQLSEKLEITSKVDQYSSEYNSRFVPDQHSQQRMHKRNGYNFLYDTSKSHQQMTNGSKERYRGRSQEPVCSSMIKTTTNLRASHFDHDVRMEQQTLRHRGRSVDLTAMGSRKAHGGGENVFEDVGQGLMQNYGNERPNNAQETQASLSARAQQKHVGRVEPMSRQTSRFDAYKSPNPSNTQRREPNTSIGDQERSSGPPNGSYQMSTEQTYLNTKAAIAENQKYIEMQRAHNIYGDGFVNPPTINQQRPHNYDATRALWQSGYRQPAAEPSAYPRRTDSRLQAESAPSCFGTREYPYEITDDGRDVGHGIQNQQISVVEDKMGFKTRQGLAMPQHTGGRYAISARDEDDHKAANLNIDRERMKWADQNNIHPTTAHRPLASNPWTQPYEPAPCRDTQGPAYIAPYHSMAKQQMTSNNGSTPYSMHASRELSKENSHRLNEHRSHGPQQLGPLLSRPDLPPTNSCRVDGRSAAAHPLHGPLHAQAPGSSFPPAPALHHGQSIQSSLRGYLGDRGVKVGLHHDPAAPRHPPTDLSQHQPSGGVGQTGKLLEQYKVNQYMLELQRNGNEAGIS